MMGEVVLFHDQKEAESNSRRSGTRYFQRCSSSCSYEPGSNSKKNTESLPNHEPVEAFHIQILSGVNNLKLSGDSTIHFITLYRMLVKL